MCCWNRFRLLLPLRRRPGKCRVSFSAGGRPRGLPAGGAVPVCVHTELHACSGQFPRARFPRWGCPGSGRPILPLPAVLDRMFVSPKCICWGTVPTVTVAGGGEAGRLGPWMGLVPFEEKQEPPGLSQPREDTEGGVRDGRGEPWDLSRPTSCQSREKWVSAVDEPRRPWCSVTAAELRHTVIHWLIRAACE